MELQLEGSLAETVAREREGLLQMLPLYLERRRWYSAKNQKTQAAVFTPLAVLPGRDGVLLAEIEMRSGSETHHWLLPMALIWQDEQQSELSCQLALARVRSGQRVGLLTDGFSLPAFAHQMLTALSDGLRLETCGSSITFEPTEGAREILRRPETASVFWITTEQSNSSVIVDDTVILKIFRRIIPGTHPEAELSRYLTLNGFANTPALYGEVARMTDSGQRSSLAVAQAFVRNQGDGWTWTLDQFDRLLNECSAQDADQDAGRGDYTTVAAAIGKRLGEMHCVLKRPSDNPAFAPETADAADVAAWHKRATVLVENAFAALKRNPVWPSEATEMRAKHLLSQQDAMIGALKTMAEEGLCSAKTRVHGDFHLGQVLVANGDVFIIDFEGEPSQALDLRRAKSSPWRDVAGLMRSIDYAAAATLNSSDDVARRSFEKRELLLNRLRDCAQTAFLDAYISVAGGTHNHALLNFFLIEKAAYEIGYEAANRPSWLPIPLDGLHRLATRILRP